MQCEPCEWCQKPLYAQCTLMLSHLWHSSFLWLLIELLAFHINRAVVTLSCIHHFYSFVFAECYQKSNLVLWYPSLVISQNLLCYLHSPAVALYPPLHYVCFSNVLLDFPITCPLLLNFNKALCLISASELLGESSTNATAWWVTKNQSDIIYVANGGRYYPYLYIASLQIRCRCSNQVWFVMCSY